MAKLLLALPREARRQAPLGNAHQVYRAAADKDAFIEAVMEWLDEDVRKMKDPDGGD